MNLISESELFLLEEVVKKNFSSKYKDSALGILWSILNPLLMMIILTIVFSTLFARNIANYPVYILTGRCLFSFFTGTVNVTMNSIKGNKNIILKTAAPKEILILGSLISEFYNFLITLLILVAIMIITNAPFYPILPLVIIPIIAEIFLIAGIGIILSIVKVYFTDIQYLWNIGSFLLFYACAIFYPMTIIPEPFYDYMILNPLYWIIDQFRQIVMYGIIPEPLYMINAILISMIVFVIGIIIFKKYEKRITRKL